MNVLPANRYFIYLFMYRNIAQFFFPFFTEKLYKEPAVRVPSLQRLSKIAHDLGLDMEERELMEYQGEFLVPVKP